jgi:WD40 repeat protein
MIPPGDWSCCNFLFCDDSIHVNPLRDTSITLSYSLDRADQVKITTAGKYSGLMMLVALSALVACKTNTPKATDPAKHRQKLIQSYGSSGAAFSPDGRLLALANRDIVWVIDTDTREVVTRLESGRFGQFGNAKGLLFIDNQRLLIGITGGIVLIDMADASYLDRYAFPNRAYVPRAMAWSPATKTLAFSTGAMPQPVNLVRISATGFGSLTPLTGFNHVPADLLFSDDGQFLGAAGDGSGVLIRQVATGDLVGELPTEGFVNELARFGDNRLLVSGADLAFWAFYTDAEMEALEDPDLKGQVDGQVAVRVVGATALGALTALLVPVAALTGTPDLVLAMGEATAHVASKPVHTAEREWCGRSTAITQDGRLLADIYPGITKEVIRIIDVESGKAIKRVNPSGDYSCNAKFSLDGSQLLITTSNVARVYNTDNWKYYDLRPE